MLQIAVTGKPNVGKSSFFNSATAQGCSSCNNQMPMQGAGCDMQSP